MFPAIRILRAKGLLVTMIFLLTAVAAPANASGITSAYPEFASASFNGWGFATGPTATTAWKWSATGWARTEFSTGTTAWIHPFGGIWSWAWRNGQWYAVKTQSIARWSCPGPADTATVVKKSLAYRYNSTLSEAQGALAMGTEVVLQCENVFADASIAFGTVFIVAPEGYALILADPKPACTIPDFPNAPVCKIAVFPRDPRPVYVLAKELEI